MSPFVTIAVPFVVTITEDAKHIHPVTLYTWCMNSLGTCAGHHTRLKWAPVRYTGAMKQAGGVVPWDRDHGRRHQDAAASSATSVLGLTTSIRRPPRSYPELRVTPLRPSYEQESD